MGGAVLRDFGTTRYLPILSISVAEMRALEELPERDKDLLLPFFRLRPWGVSNRLQNTLNRLGDAYGDRPYIADVLPPVPLTGEEREVHRELGALRASAGGYSAWTRFVEERANIIPCVQLGDLAELQLQIENLYRLGRGLVVYLEPPAFGRVADIARVIGEITGRGSGVQFILDMGQRGRELLLATAESVGLVRTILRHAPDAVIALSASSFPSDFVGLDRQDIYERQHFDGVARELPLDRLVYSDRGSARAEKQMGGGGTPAPRVDLPGNLGWEFYRDETDGNRSAGYFAQANACKKSAMWDENLRLWGVQMIERTAGEDSTAIKSPASSAAARINIHLHRQLFYGDPAGLYATDEEWTD
jgi:hypothetical protein